MAYEEVGGCCTESYGFFHGECPIHETGRQSYAKRLTYINEASEERYACDECPFVQFGYDFLDPETESWFSALFMSGCYTPGSVS